jgi:hypothetical protein
MVNCEVEVADIVAYAKQIADGRHDTITPGQPYTFSEACVDGDAVWQGDFGIVLVDDEDPPRGYVERQAMFNLVPGNENTIGSKHCLASLEGVKMYVPSEWNELSLNGPFLKLTNGATITHPVHGDVTIPACFKSVQIVYQREWDSEQAAERRARD